MSGQLKTLCVCMCDKDIWLNYVIAISGHSFFRSVYLSLTHTHTHSIDRTQECAHTKTLCIKTFMHAPKQKVFLCQRLNPSRYMNRSV